MPTYFCNCDALTLKGGRVVRFGGEIPEAQGWSYPVLKAHLNWGKIREVKDGAAASRESARSSVAVHVSSAAHSSAPSVAPAGVTVPSEPAAEPGGEEEEDRKPRAPAKKSKGRW